VCKDTVLLAGAVPPDMIRIEDIVRLGVWLGRYISQKITEVTNVGLSGDRNLAQS